jgi:CysZ protein
MSFLKDLNFGLEGYSLARKFIFKHKLQYFFLVPLVLSITLLISGFSLTGMLNDLLWERLQEWWDPDSWDFWGAEFLNGFLAVLIWLVFRILFFFIYAFVGGYIILIIMAPVLAYISEKTESIILGHDFPFSWPQFFKDIWRGIVLAIRNFFIEILATIVLFFLSFVPLLGFITGPLLFMITAYFYGFSFMDYTAERRKMKVKESVDFVKQNRGIAIANGGVFALFLIIPFIGVTLATFVAIVSTVAASISILKKENPDLEVI